MAQDHVPGIGQAEVVAGAEVVNLAEDGRQGNVHGVAGAEDITPLVFAVIVGTVAIYGLGMGPLARSLGLAQKHSEGALILGAGPVERAIARALSAAGVVVVVATTNRRDHYQARMEELRSFYGNLLDRDVELDLDLSGIGQLLAMTPNDDVNTLACSRYAELFGGAYVYQLQPAGLPAGIESSPAGDLGGRFLFAPGYDYRRLRGHLAEGGQIRRTKLSDTYSLDGNQFAFSVTFDDNTRGIYIGTIGTP